MWGKHRVESLLEHGKKPKTQLLNCSTDVSIWVIHTNNLQHISFSSTLATGQMVSAVEVRMHTHNSLCQTHLVIVHCKLLMYSVCSMLHFEAGT